MGGADFVCLYTRTIKLNGNRMIDCDLYNLLAAVLQIFGEIICLLLGEVALWGSCSFSKIQKLSGKN